MSDYVDCLPPPNERSWVTSKDFLKALHEAGLLPQYPWLSRVVIDAKIGDVVKMYVDQIPSGALLNVAPLMTTEEIVEKEEEGEAL